MTMPTRAQLTIAFEQERFARERLLNALPDHGVFQVDPALIQAQALGSVRQEGPDLTGLCYALFEGRGRGGPCALLAVSNDPARLPTARWVDDVAWLTRRNAQTGQTSGYRKLNPAVAQATMRAAELLGRTTETGERLAERLLAFRIERCERSLTHRPRGKALTAEQEVVAEALARCLAHLLDPTRLPMIRAIRYPVSIANLGRVSRTARGYLAGHERSL
ncbi:MAG: hypothetical protein EOM21_13170 [Gammaproteobacteria bacterium]|nr:hypothetical protein [Gammaproteobacteria bacterium]